MARSRFLLGLLIAATALILAVSPALAYGAETYQVTFSGTGTAAGTGNGFGFWGWCAFGGGNATSGTTGDCEFAQYFHAPAGSGFTCHESLDLSSWNIGPNGDFFITGTAMVTPSGATGPCLAFFPGPGLSSFTNVDSLIPAATGHHNLGSLGPGLVGSFQVQVNLLP